MEINDSFFIEVLESLEKHKVNYLLVGGMAVAYYGYHRYTGDMDLWLEPTSKNLEKLYLALGEDLKYDQSIIKEIKKNRDLKNPTPIRLFSDDEIFKVDLMTNILQEKFDWKEAIKDAKEFELENLKIPVIHINHLIYLKENSKRVDGNMKDLIDAEQLKKILKNKK